MLRSRLEDALSGMKLLGRIAYNAAAEYARSRSTCDAGIEREQVHGHVHAHLRGAAMPLSNIKDGRDCTTITSGSYVKVPDLRPLIHESALSHPQLVTEFVAAQHQPISHLVFTHHGIHSLLSPGRTGCARLPNTMFGCIERGK